MHGPGAAEHGSRFSALQKAVSISTIRTFYDYVHYTKLALACTQISSIGHRKIHPSSHQIGATVAQEDGESNREGEEAEEELLQQRARASRHSQTENGL